VRWTLIPRNITEAVTPPRPIRKEIKPLSREQARTLLEASKSDPLHTFYVLAVTTGMRNGEMIGLQWKDVDLDLETLEVRRTVFNGVVSPPKTAGNRTIRLTGLKEHGLCEAKQRISEWVFPSRRGTPLDVHNVHNRSWKPLLKRAGLPASTRMHDLRHTCATLLLSSGVPVKVVSELLGDASVSITLDTYSQVLPSMQETAAKAMEGVLE
jgi:integrase